MLLWLPCPPALFFLAPLQVQLPLAAAVSLLEGFAGLSDPASLATILAGIAPRALLLLGGGSGGGGNARGQLAAAISAKLSGQKTQILQPGE